MDSPPLVTFGELLRHYRLAAGMTQEELAERAQVSSHAISDLERGLRSRPWRDTVQHLADALPLGGTERAQLEAVARRLGSPSAGQPQARRARQGTVVAETILPPSRHDLPAPLTTFIGRERELAAVLELLRDVRLVTLTGPPGSGKTRLALAVARALSNQFADGVCFVSLAPVADPDLALPTVARALGLRENGAHSVAEILRASLATRELLLVLDNFEQILGAGPSVAELAVGCPRLRVLVTSRATLRVYGEHDFPVPPLALPGTSVRLPVDLANYEAVRLFVDRARAVHPTLRMTDDNAQTVAEICRRLDGLPLAIELAAVRARHLTLPAILTRLDRRLPLLIDGPRDLPTRQRTMRKAIAWSEDLLLPLEQVLFQRLAVFVGGFAAEAVRDVCFASEDSPDDFLPLLGSLVDNNLLRWEEQDGEPRYRMLPVIREYALDRLGESGERGPVERRHATYYGELAEASEATWGPELSKRLDLLDREQDNVRQALEFALESQDVDLSLRLGAALVQFWRVRGRYEEGRRYLERILALPGPAGLAQMRAKALHGAGLLAFHLQDWETALERFEASLEIWRAAGDRRRAAWVLHDLGLMGRYQDDYVTALVRTEESLALFRETHDDVGQAAALRELAFAAHHRGDLATAAELGEQSLALARRSRDTWHVAHALRVLGTVARDRGDFASAQRRFEECLTIFRSFSDWPAVVGVQDDLVRVVATGGSSAAAGGLDDASIAALAQESTSAVIAAAWLYRRAWIARGQGDHRQALALFQKSMVQFHAARRPTRMVGCLMSLADLAISLDQPERAARLIGAALGICNATGMHLSASERGELAHIVTAGKTRLGEESIRALMAEGEAMTQEQAIAYALEETG